ncbi:hypothetical protein BC830DRAFT_1095216 [Chytriomyces sp. MP71]|nr:hypothetical protein BC830DRAFT_1095216 [Chytriomyces sp. MP71]
MTSNSNLIAHLTAQLQARGFDLVVPFRTQVYNACCLETASGKPLPPLPTFQRSSTCALLIGNTKSLWPHFVAHCKRNAETVSVAQDPLDDFVSGEIEAAITAEAPSVVSETRFTHSKEDKFVHFQRLAHEVGAAFFNKSVFLCVHPVYGPWFAFRAVIAFDLDFDSFISRSIANTPVNLNLPTPIADPFPECQFNVQECMNQFYAAAKDYNNRADENHKYLIAARDAATTMSAQEYRYEADQLRYHYTKDKTCLGIL